MEYNEFKKVYAEIMPKEDEIFDVEELAIKLYTAVRGRPNKWVVERNIEGIKSILRGLGWENTEKQERYKLYREIYHDYR